MLGGGSSTQRAALWAALGQDACEGRSLTAGDLLDTAA